MRPSFLFQTLWKHRRLLWQFTVRNVELRHKGSHLGLVWSFLGPLLTVGLYVLVFGFIFRGRFKSAAETPVEYALVVFLGLAVYHFLAEVVAASPTLILNNPNLVKKVVFPLEILPVASVGAALFHFFITLALVFTGAFLAGVPVGSGVIWLPVIVVPLLGIVTGIALLFSAVGLFVRDLSQLTQFFLLVVMFTSAVFYPTSRIPPVAWSLLKFNPFLHIIDEARNVTFWGIEPNAAHLIYLYLCSGLALWVGALVFRRLRSSFADVL